MKNRAAVRLFKQQHPAMQAGLTLGGTGPNGALQTWVLNVLGQDYLKDLQYINLLSGSVFSYAIFLGLSDKQLTHRERFENFDQYNRQQHGASFLRACRHLLSGSTKQQGVFDNHSLGDALSGVFSEQLSGRTLKELPENIHFFTYCSQRKAVLDLHARSETFADLTLSQLASACASAIPVHGHFYYQDYQLSDPMFSPDFAKLRKQLFSSPGQHLYLNYKKEGQSGNICFVKHDTSSYPKVALYRDFIKFYLNIPNPVINRVHREILSCYRDDS